MMKFVYFCKDSDKKDCVIIAGENNEFETKRHFASIPAMAKEYPDEDYLALQGSHERVRKRLAIGDMIMRHVINEGVETGYGPYLVVRPFNVPQSELDKLMEESDKVLGTSADMLWKDTTLPDDVQDAHAEIAKRRYNDFLWRLREYVAQIK